ncbi:MAG: GxxExxY protein [Chitinophagaceae bacterium]|nr:MAG: GxxExxY protein [Chitinophagaceae bacterium]
MKENEIADAVLDHAFRIHRQYGPGLLESVYEEVLCYELRKAGHTVYRQQQVSLIHEELYIPIAFRADLIVDHLLLVELKSVSDLPRDCFKIVNTYLRLSHIRLGLVINFGAGLLKDGIRRVANGL